MNETLDAAAGCRLADRLSPIADAMEALDRQKAELDRQRAVLAASIPPAVQAAIAERPPSDDEIAEAYWRLEIVPVSLLGKPYDILQIARKYPHWSWTCPQCGREVFCTSRTEKQQLACRSTYAPKVCTQCAADRQASREVEWAAARALKRQREHELATMPYKDYLRTQEWQDRRAVALRRAHHRCQVCNRERVLHVHHRTYERRGNELSRDLITLCDQCHSLYHGKGLLASHEDAESGGAR